MKMEIINMCSYIGTLSRLLQCYCFFECWHKNIHVSIYLVLTLLLGHFSALESDKVTSLCDDTTKE